jgi:hypothetical protein
VLLLVLDLRETDPLDGAITPRGGCYCALKLKGTTTFPPSPEVGNDQPFTFDATQLARPG